MHKVYLKPGKEESLKDFIPGFSPEQSLVSMENPKKVKL